MTYSIQTDASWVTRSARITARSVAGPREIFLVADRAGGWLVNGERTPGLNGCLDVDLESSAMTNTLPVHRLGLAVGGQADAPAAYVRALDLSVDRLEQTYRRLADEGGHQRYDYAAPAFGFTSRLTYDESGLVLDYPGIARRGLIPVRPVVFNRSDGSGWIPTRVRSTWLFQEQKWALSVPNCSRS